MWDLGQELGKKSPSPSPIPLLILVFLLLKKEFFSKPYLAIAESSLKLILSVIPNSVIKW
jgi:hypothetical protein